MTSPRVLSPEFFESPDVVHIARALLGKVLVSTTGGLRTAGTIVETEAYGADDKASHAHLQRRTVRTAPMFAAGGTAYVYLCYGIHHLFNVSTNKEGIAEAVLIRGIEPLEGVEHMMTRRGMATPHLRLTAGPGALTVAFGISARHNGLRLPTDDLWLEDRGFSVPEEDVVARTRVGIAYAAEDAYLPYRFSIRGNKWVSRAKGL